jgi:uncharacterized protein YciI
MNTILRFACAVAVGSALFAFDAEAPAAKPTHFVIFESGTGKRPDDAKVLQQMQKDHIGNLDRLAKEGKCQIAGPLRDGGAKRGIVLLTLGGDDAVAGAFEPDPFVRDGLLTVRAMTIDVTTGKPGKAEEPFVLADYVIAFVTLVADADGEAEERARGGYAALEKRLRETEGSELALAGATRGDDAIIGVMLFGTADKEAVAAAIEKARGEASEYEVALHGQMLARGSLEAAPAKPKAAAGGDRSDGQ